MKCHYHPDRDSVNNCAICGKPICSECGMEVGGNILCKDCVNSLISDSLTSKVSEKINQTKNESNKDRNISEQPQTTQQPKPEPQPQTTQQPKPEHKIEKTSSIKQEPANIFNNDNEEKIEENTPEINNSSEKITKQKELEDKYEKYLDDLYFDEPDKEELNLENYKKEEDLSLSEQLSNDEELNKKVPYEKPSKKGNQGYYAGSVKEDEKKYVWSTKPNMNHKPSRNNLNRNFIEKNKPKKEKEPYSATDIILTIILIILILIVIFYIVYLFALSSNYPTFLEAVIGLVTNPIQFIGTIFS